MRSAMEWAEQRERLRNGESITHLAREYRLSRNTVKRYVKAENPPRYERKANQQELLKPHKDFIRGRLTENDLTAMRLLEEI